MCRTAERTVENTWKRIGTLLDAFSPSEYANLSKTPDMLST